MDRKTVLIVEDEAIIAADLANKVEHMGFDVIGTALNVEEALNIVLDLCPKIVLMDINLGELADGVRLAKVVQTICDRLPVVFISGLHKPEELENANLSGPYAFISKPFDSAKFALEVEKILN